MRHLHIIRLSESDAITLEFMYAACQSLDIRRYARAHTNLRDYIKMACEQRRLPALPLGWSWSFAGRALYISNP